MTMMARSRISKPTTALAACALIAIVVLLFYSHAGVYLRGALANLLAQPSVQSEYAPLSRDALIARLTNAEKQLSRVKYQALLYGLITQENESLRKAAGAATVPQGITGRVITRPPKSAYDTLMLDVGKNQGIVKDDLVVFESIALGKIISIGDTTSLVQLFSSPGAEHDVLIGEPHAVSVAKGQGGGTFELSLPQSVAVAQGDIVRIPGTETLILGVVVSVEAQSVDVTQTVHIASPVSFADLDFVRVLPREP